MKGEFLSVETARIMADIEKENKELQERIDKAIDYINHNSAKSKFSNSQVVAYVGKPLNRKYTKNNKKGK